MPKQKKNLTPRQQLKAIAGVAKLSFRTAPGAVMFKMAGSVLDAVLPIVTTFFAALTTTELAAAYAGEADAGRQAIIYVIITAVLGLLMTVWRSIDQYIQAQMRYKVEARVGDMMYEHFLQLDFWHYDDKDTADLYERAQKFAQFFAWVFDRIAGIISQFIMMVLGVAALAFVSGWIALIVLVAIIPGVFIQIKLSRAQIAHWNKNVDVRRAKGNIEWNLLQPKSIAELRLYGLVGHLLKLRASLRDKDEKARIDFEKSYIPKRLMADGLEAAAEVISLIWITVQIINRAQPIGQFLYVQQIVSRSIGAASGFVSQLSSIDEDIANLYDYEQFMDLPKRSGGNIVLQKMPSRIEINNISFKYRGSNKFVLQNINFAIEQGKHIAIVGENGAGKSTLIKLLAGLYDPTSGSISLDGVNLKEIDINSWHKYIGVLQQDFLHYTFATAKQNIIFGDVEKPLDRQNIQEALVRAEATEFIDELPNKLDNYVSNWMEDDEGNKGVDLSGGQWQRLALARNFYRDAPIIILDEPTSAIDALAESRIFKRLFADEGRTIITISHRLTTVEKADRIYMFQDGQIVESGTHTELIRLKGAYYRMFEGQLQEAVAKKLAAGKT